MNKTRFLVVAASIGLLVITAESFAGRGGRGGGGGGRGGFTAPAQPATHSASPSAASHPSTMPAGHASGTGPNGGTWQSGKGGGSYTTQGGHTIEYKGAAVGGTGAGGGTGGKYVGGVQITTAGGQTITKAGRGGAAVGPGGNAVGGKSSITHTTGPQGTGTAAQRSGFVAGPGGTAAYRGGVAVGPGGAAAYRGGAVATPHGTYYRSAAAVSGQGAYVRTGCTHYHGCFTQAWYGRYPGAWYPGKYPIAAWTTATMATIAAFSGGGGGSSGDAASEPTSYDYGTNVTETPDGVYVDGEKVATSEEYLQQAATIADTGKKAEASKEEEWLPLGVFAMVKGEETTSDNIFQLAINKAGVVRGNYYNALTDSTEPVYGSMDKKTQRCAWTVGERKAPVYEAGIVNLTKDDTTMMVHYSKDKSQQFTLYRIEKPEEDGKAPEEKK